MFKNYFKTALRNLWKNKTFSFLNIVGLAIGIACAGLIFLWVEDEVNFDSFNVKKHRLHVAYINASFDAGIFTHWSTPGVMAPVMQAEIPGIANTCRATEDQTRLLFSIGDKSVYASGKYAETSLFTMFTLPFTQGNAKTAFSQLHSLVITEKTAMKFFPQDAAHGNGKNVIGKTVRVDNGQNYVITGVLKDIPDNSSLQFEWVAPFQTWYQQNPWAQSWENIGITTYVELEPWADAASINKQLYSFIQKRAPSSINRVFLFPMNDWRLYNDFENGKQTRGGRIEYVRMFSVIAWIILIIACINFMNLATARSEKRAKEVGVRKVLGSGRRKLVAQFIGEALFMTFLATIVALMIMILALPTFNMLVQKNLLLGINRPLHLSLLILIAFICGLVAGSYPSLYLSSFNPVIVLKGFMLKKGSAAFVRKGLVILQFTVSIVLMIGTIIIYRQIQHVKKRNLGFDKNNLVEISMQGDMATHFDAIKQDLINTGMVENVAVSDHETIYGGNYTDNLSWAGKPPGNKTLISWRSVGPEFIATSGLQILKGRDFQLTDSVNYDIPVKFVNVIVTQSLEKLMGNGSAIGKILFRENDTTLYATVVGVANDYVHGNMYDKPGPIVYFCIAPRFSNLMYIRCKAQRNLKQTLAKIEAVIKRNNPAYPFEYRFVDDQFNKMFQTEMLISKLSTIFATLAIVISCLGLFGLSAYTAERRKKEIGIRKVLGASVLGIAGLLSKDFIKLVLIASVIGFPMAWWAMNSWLQNYPYRIKISWWIFVITGIAALLIAMLTISVQAIRAAIANPAKSLRTE